VVEFSLDDLIEAATRLNIPRPRNINAIVYAFRMFQQTLPDSILEKAPSGKHWIIRQIDKGRFRFVAVAHAQLFPSTSLNVVKLLDSTPGLVAAYSQTDERSLLAAVRYNRLVDIFTGLTAYSLQVRLRTRVTGIGQIETDEIYLAHDARGVHFVIPVQAKGAGAQLSVVQVEQDIAMCAQKFPGLVCLALSAVYTLENMIAMFSFEQREGEVVIAAEKHYRLVSPDQLTADDLASYRLEDPQV
jgi:hypothetical protein